MTSSADTMMMMRPEDQALLKAMPGNDRCIDCGRRSPEWASVTLSVFVCLECSGKHRGLGTHISFIRSVKMDSWTVAQIKSMTKGGGNDACKEFLATRGGIDTSVLGETSIQEKYDSPAAELWRQVIKARVAGTEEPTELPELTKSSDDEQSDSDETAGNKNTKNGGKHKTKKYHSIQGGRGGGAVGGAVKVMEGFGSSPHPSELKGANRKRRGRRIMGLGAAAVGAIAAVGMAARNRRNNQKGGPAVTLSNRV